MNDNDTLNNYLAKWHLTEAEHIASTNTSTVYRVSRDGETFALKLLNENGRADEHAGAIALRYFDGEGAVRLIAADSSAHLLEYVTGADLIPMVERNGDAEATRIIAETLNHLHQVREKTIAAGLISLKQRFRALYARAEQDKRAGQPSIYGRAANMADDLLATPLDMVVLHGDMHHANIRHHPERGWLAFDPKGLYGERTFDAANTLCNPIDMPELLHDENRLLQNAEILAETMVIPVQRLLKFTFVYACLSAAWLAEDQSGGVDDLFIAQMVEGLIE